MRTASLLVGALAAVTVGVSAATTAAPAAAQVAEPCAPGQPFDRQPGEPPTAPPRVPSGRPPQYPPGKCELLLSRTVAVPGQSLTLVAAGYLPRSGVALAVAGEPAGDVEADDAGAFVADMVVPGSVRPGVHRVSASGVSRYGEPYVLSASLTVTTAERAAGAVGEASAGGASGSAAASARRPRVVVPAHERVLARTGSAPAGALAVSVALLVTGSLAVLASRRRPS